MGFLEKTFGRLIAPNPTEKTLKELRVEYQKQSDGTLVVDGNVDLSGKGLTRLPDLSKAVVKGHFICSANKLTSLEGAPVAVGRGFWCDKNQLTSLEHAPATVGFGFFCSDNQLTSLKHAPSSFDGHFICSNNQLTSLEHAPLKFSKLVSDLGAYTSCEQIPEQLRLSPEARARLETQKVLLEQEREKAFSEGSTVLQASIKVSSPLRLKK